jgi:hypothetical protein
MQRFSLLMLTLLLAACSQRYMVSDDLAYAYNLPPVGSTLVLKRAVEIPAGEARIFLQNGKPMKKSDFDRYKPSCSFEVRKLADQPREIDPDSFLVTQVQRLTEQVVQRSAPSTGFVKVDVEAGGGKPLVVHGYHLWLGSDRQPNVMRMTCLGAFDDLNRAVPPSLEDVKKTLGDYAELMLPI